MKIKLLAALFLVSMLIQACRENKNQNEAEANVKLESKKINDNIEEEAFDFLSDTCNAKFRLLAEHNISPTESVRYLSGKGWNSESESCTFTWGEIISNTFADSTDVTYIYLVDLDTISDLRSANPENSDFKEKIIAISEYNKSTHKNNVIWNPSGNSKYRKPKDWED